MTQLVRPRWRYNVRMDPSPLEDSLQLRWRDAFPVTFNPEEVDLTEYLPPVFDQGQEGSCTAASGKGVMETLERQAGRPYTPLSAAFLYQAERTLQGTLYQDSGARLRDTELALTSVGVPPEPDDPYTPADFVVNFTPAMVADARAHRIAEGWWCPTVPEMLSALTAGYPVQIAVLVYQSFESPYTLQSGQVVMPGLGEQLMGGHAMYMHGYRLRETTPIIGRGMWRNSWGENVGIGGNFLAPLEYLDHRDTQAPETFMSARAYKLAAA